MKLLSKCGDLAIIKMPEPVFGGWYAVVKISERRAKTGLCLDAAMDIFKELTGNSNFVLNVMTDEQDQ